MLSLFMLAAMKILDLTVNGYWSHDNLNCNVQCRMQQIGVVQINENLYKGNSCDIRYALSAWEQSTTHKQVLDSSYSQGVVLIQRDGRECYIVMDVR
jgi:uncharacterized protein YkwD